MKDNAFATTIKTEGALLPADLLRRVQAGDRTLPGLTPEAYHLPGGMRLNEAASRAWNALLGAWTTFQEARERLPEGDLGTTVTRERWLLPLFQELNYGRLQARTAVEIDGKIYAVSHGYGHAPVHLVGCNVDLDRRTRGVAGAATASPHSLVQELLNRSDEHLWGVVSNGLRLRVLRDNKSLTRQAFLEFDLEAMMEGEQYSDFVLLYLLLHQSRLESDKPEECVLEQWSREAAETGARALDGLRDGVERAITALGKGFLRGGNGELKRKLQEGELLPQDYYRQLLRLVYRLLFLFVAEDRDLLHAPGARAEARQRYQHYSTQRLRELSAELRGGRHGDLYEALKGVMRALGSGGEPRLGLPELGGFLFAERALSDLKGTSLPNAYLLQAVRALAYTHTNGVRRPVDYKNLGSEELGSVYESLLELHPEVDASGNDFELKSAAGNERKTTGSYYTPSSLIGLLLDSALDPVVDEAVLGKEREDAERALLGLKVVDPAAGSGHFLIAAAQRIAKRLAAVRTGDDEPAPDEVRRALRDVIGNCIYGVDVNEMAAELCKVALWMEAMEPGKPLTFLEHHIRVGNSLFGTSRKLVEEGIPDSAFDPLEGEDREFASAVKQRNREERGGQSALFDSASNHSATALATSFERLSRMPTDTPDQVRAKQDVYERLLEDELLAREKLAHDAWCAAFVWRKVKDAPRPITTDDLTRVLETGVLAEDRRLEIDRLSKQFGFFSWELAFPEVFDGAHPGFDAVVGNPPWEVLENEEKKFFAGRDDDIAAANTAVRKELIRNLTSKDPVLFKEWEIVKYEGERFKAFHRSSGRFPLSSYKKLNLYASFLELSLHLVSAHGRVGLIVQSGLATDESRRYLFQELTSGRRLLILFDFENSELLFRGVHAQQRFSVVVISGHKVASDPQFSFNNRNVQEARDHRRTFRLSADDLELLSPETGSCPTFTDSQEAELIKTIYRSSWVPAVGGSGPRLFGTLTQHLNSSTHRHLFKSYQATSLAEAGSQKVYEGKYISNFDHRAGTFEGVPFSTWDRGSERKVSTGEKESPSFSVLPRWWLKPTHSDRQLGSPWHLVFGDIANPQNERTASAAIIPASACSDTLWMLGEFTEANQALLLCATINSIVFDFVVRRRIGSRHLKKYIFEQLPFPKFDECAEQLPIRKDAVSSWFGARVLELSYVSWDLRAFAQEFGVNSPPFLWNESRRRWIRAELDAALFHLYGIARIDVEYVLETFTLLKRRELDRSGRFETKEMILNVYDEMSKCVQAGREYCTRLSPPPAHPSLTHDPTTRPEWA